MVRLRQDKRTPPVTIILLSQHRNHVVCKMESILEVSMKRCMKTVYREINIVLTVLEALSELDIVKWKSENWIKNGCAPDN